MWEYSTVGVQVQFYITQGVKVLLLLHVLCNELFTSDVGNHYQTTSRVYKAHFFKLL